MLLNDKNEVVVLDKRATDYQRASVREVLIPTGYKGKLFQLGERAVLKDKKKFS